MTWEGPAHCAWCCPWTGEPDLVRKQGSKPCSPCLDFSSCLLVPAWSPCPDFPTLWWPTNELCHQMNLFLSELLLVMVSYLNTRMQTSIPRLASNSQQLSPQPPCASILGVADRPGKNSGQLRTSALCTIPTIPISASQKWPCCWPSQQPIPLFFHPTRTPVLSGFPFPGLGLPDVLTSTVLGLSVLSSHADVQPQTDLEHCNIILLRWTSALGLWEMPSWVTHRGQWCHRLHLLVPHLQLALGMVTVSLF